MFLQTFTFLKLVLRHCVEYIVSLWCRMTKICISFRLFCAHSNWPNGQNHILLNCFLKLLSGIRNCYFVKNQLNEENDDDTEPEYHTFWFLYLLYFITIKSAFNHYYERTLFLHNLIILNTWKFFFLFRQTLLQPKLNSKKRQM